MSAIGAGESREIRVVQCGARHPARIGLYQTDAGMCGDYNSVIGMNTENSLNRFLKKDSVKHFPAVGDATLCGVVVDCNLETGLADKIESYKLGGQLTNS